MSKIISVSDEVYEKLKVMKGNESFSYVLRKILKKETNKEEVLKLKPVERRWYEIKLPLWYVRKNKEDAKGLAFCDVDYNSNIGAIFIKDKQVASMII